MDNRARLAMLTAQVSQFTAQEIVKSLQRSGPDLPKLLPSYVEKGWQTVALPVVLQLAEKQGLDPQPLQQDDSYRDLFNKILLEHLARLSAALDAAVAWHDDRRSGWQVAEQLAAELAAASTGPVLAVADAAPRDWLLSGFARWTWDYRAWPQLYQQFRRDQMRVDAANFRGVFERAFREAQRRALPNAPADAPSDAPADVPVAAPVAAPPGVQARWQHIGPPRPQAVGLPDPTGQTDYGLCNDPVRGLLAYVQRIGERSIGPLWYRRDGQWQRESASAVDLASEPCAQLSCHFDAGRGGIACWTYVRHDVFDAVPVGVLLGPAGAALIPTTDAPPVKRPSEFSAAFAYDRRRDVTVAITTSALWELTRDGRWTQRLDGGEQRPETRLPGKLLGAAYDPRSGRVLIGSVPHWSDSQRRDQGLCFAVWDGDKLLALEAPQLPLARGHSDGLAAAFCEHPQHGLLAYLPEEDRLYRLGERGFEPCEQTAPPPSPRRQLHPLLAELEDLAIEPLPPQAEGPTWFEDVRAAWDASDGSLVLGPGYYRERTFGRRRRHVFFTRREGAWTRTAYPELTLPDSYQLRFLADGPAGSLGPVAIGSRHGLRRLDAESGWTECGADLSDEACAVVSGPGGTPYAVASSGAVSRLVAVADRPGAAPAAVWQRLSAPAPLPSGAAEVLRPPSDRDRGDAVYDLARDRIVIWHQPFTRDQASTTALWQSGAWSVRAQEGPHPDAAFGCPDSTVRLVFDSALAQVLRIGASQVAVLVEDRWVPLPVDPVLAAVHPDFRTAVHDPESGQTLVIDFVAQLVIRFDLGGCAVVGCYERPQGFVLTGRPRHGHPGFPLSHTGYHALHRCLRTHSSQDPWGSYELDLAPFFAAAARLGPRTPLPERL